MIIRRLSLRRRTTKRLSSVVAIVALFFIAGMCAPNSDKETTAQADSTASAAADTASIAAAVTNSPADEPAITEPPVLNIENIAGDMVSPEMAAYLTYPLNNEILLIAPHNGIAHNVYSTRNPAAGATPLTTLTTPTVARKISEGSEGTMVGDCTREVWYKIAFQDNGVDVEGWVSSFVNGIYEFGVDNIGNKTYEFPDAGGRVVLAAMVPLSTYVSWGEGEQCVDMYLMFFHDNNRIYLIENKEQEASVFEPGKDYLTGGVHMDNFCNGLFGYLHQMKTAPGEVETEEAEGSVMFKYNDKSLNKIHHITISWADGKFYSHDYKGMF